MLNKISALISTGLVFLNMTVIANSHAITPTPLTPFNAQYEISKGRLTLGTAKSQLSQIGENSYTLSYFSNLSLLILSDRRRETSELVIKDGQIQTKRYLFKREGTGSDKSTQLEFKNSEVIDIETDKPLELDNTIAWFDEISYQLQLKLDLTNQVTPLKYYLVNHKKQDKLYEFEIVGEEQIKVPAGTFNTIKILRVRDEGSSRKTETWLAPEYGYMMIRIRQEKDGSEQLDAQLEKFVFNQISPKAN